jgi:hypothetical protein
MECYFGAAPTPLIPILDLMMNMKYLVLLPLTAMLSACGGGSDDSTNTSSPHGEGGLYFGAYAETAGGTDADSAVGGLYLQLPSKDSDFNGRMSFQYRDCQNTNALKISGEKLLKELTLGRVEGLLDPVATDDKKVFFSFSGSYSTNSKLYGGSYDRVGTTSNEARTAAGCLSYMLAYKGRWVAWPQGSHSPANFNIFRNGNIVQWPVVDKMSKTVVMFLDPSKVTTAGADAVILQRVVDGLPATTLAPSASAGKTYRVVVQVFDVSNSLIAYDDATMTF